jgi:tetratricopeptide (TPR) repeat protein
MNGLVKRLIKGFIKDLAIALLSLAATSACAQVSASGEVLSPAQQKIAWAQAEIGKNPKRYQPHNQLAIALARRARETSDVNYYVQAEAALDKSFALSPGNLDGLKAQTWILLGKHEFAKAAALAKQLNERWPDDVLIYGFLTDANVELGNYADAEKAAQWMLDIRPGNVPGLTRAAYLRELFGDIDGSLELMEMAYQQTPQNELEDRAWILTQIAHLRSQTGRLSEAENLLQQALVLFPNYHYALGQLARVKTMQGRHSEAVDLLSVRYRNAAHAENAYTLAEALERAGRTTEAQKLFAEFEATAQKELGLTDNANRELIFYYVDHANRPVEALRIAELELARRHDAYTVDAYAWALSANGKNDEAQANIERALTVGLRDAQLLYHAGAIAARSGNVAAARNWLKESIDANPASEYSGPARDALAKLPALSIAL